MKILIYEPKQNNMYLDLIYEAKRVEGHHIAIQSISTINDDIEVVMTAPLSSLEADMVDDIGIFIWSVVCHKRMLRHLINMGVLCCSIEFCKQYITNTVLQNVFKPVVNITTKICTINKINRVGMLNVLIQKHYASFQI